MFKLVSGTALALAIVAAPAAAATYTTSTNTYTSLGDRLGTPFDLATLNGVTGTATAPGTYLVNTVDFTAGYNSNDDHTDTGTLTNSALVDGATFSYSVPYTIAISSSDTLTLGGNSFDVNGVRVHFNTLTLVSGGETESGNLTATVSVPEPASWAMMVAGLGLVGLGVRRRTAAVAA